MSKDTTFLDIVDAAAMLNVTTDKIVEMRHKGDIFGYRDGSTWKFKLSEVERVLNERDTISRVALADAVSRVALADAVSVVRMPRNPGSPDDLREMGLSVAVHNDYRLNGVRHTFWLMTIENQRDGQLLAFKGEGKTDAEALAIIRAEVAKLKESGVI